MLFWHLWSHGTNGCNNRIDSISHNNINIDANNTTNINTYSNANKNVANITNEMTDDLKNLKETTINLFNITYNYLINGSSLNSLEKLIPILLECGTIMIDTYSSQTALHDIFNKLVQARKEIDSNESKNVILP